MRNVDERMKLHTKLTLSRAARARMSAHETVALQDASTWLLIVSMTSNPRAEFTFGPAFFSPVKVEVSSSKIEPSHPYKLDNERSAH